MRGFAELLGFRRAKSESGLIHRLEAQPPRGITIKDYHSFFESHSLEKPLTDSAEWSSPKIPFAKMVETYETVVSVSFGIDFLTEAIVGPGFYISATNENIKDYISSYAEEIRLDSFNAIVTQRARAPSQYPWSVCKFQYETLPHTRRRRRLRPGHE